MTTKTIKAKVKKEMPVVVYLVSFGFSLMGYIIGRIALQNLPHYYHWLSGLAGGVLGFAISWFYYKRRGDI